MGISDIMTEIGKYEKSHQSEIYTLMNEYIKAEPDEVLIKMTLDKLAYINQRISTLFSELEIAIEEDREGNK